MKLSGKEKAFLLRKMLGSEETALAGLRLLERSSSAIKSALTICGCVNDPQTQERVARAFVNVYASGFIAAIDELERAPK